MMLIFKYFFELLIKRTLACRLRRLEGTRAKILTSCEMNGHVMSCNKLLEVVFFNLVTSSENFYSILLYMLNRDYVKKF